MLMKLHKKMFHIHRMNILKRLIQEFIFRMWNEKVEHTVIATPELSVA